MNTDKIIKIRIDYADGEYFVQCLTEDGIEGDGTFASKSAAVARAKQLAKLYGCDWED